MKRCSQFKQPLAAWDRRQTCQCDFFNLVYICVLNLSFYHQEESFSSVQSSDSNYVRRTTAAEESCPQNMHQSLTTTEESGSQSFHQTLTAAVH